jgi:hypothetical protein
LHNQKFAELAAELILDATKDSKIRWSPCMLRTASAGGRECAGSAVVPNPVAEAATGWQESRSKRDRFGAMPQPTSRRFVRSTAGTAMAAT